MAAELLRPLETLSNCNRHSSGQKFKSQGNRFKRWEKMLGNYKNRASHPPSGTGSGLSDTGAETRLLVLRGSRRYAPGQARPLLQGEELSLPFQSTLLSVPLQRGWVPLRGRNELTAGPEGMEPEILELMLTES